MGKVIDAFPNMPKTIRNPLVTQQDLEDFKIDLLQSIKSLLTIPRNPVIKKWLKSYEVIKLLAISKGTLQSLRSRGTLPFTKIGGIIYYDTEEINKLLIDRKRHYIRGMVTPRKS